MKRPLARVGLVALGCCLAMNAQAFELILKPTSTEAKRAKMQSGISFRVKYPAAMGLVHAFADPVHEGLAHLAYECPLDFRDCADSELDSAPGGVIIGLRWNDDPPFQFAKGQGKYKACRSYVAKGLTVSYALAFDCWLRHFQDVKGKAASNPAPLAAGQGTMLARSHFGDLQFLHAMASDVGVPASVTQSKIMMWAEFTWRIQSRDRTERIAANTRMGQVPVTGMSAHFPETEERTVELLFGLGRTWVRHQLPDIAFGSLLHMLQDSFAGGHTKRRVVSGDGCGIPVIVQFHSYVGQPDADHKERDGIDRATAKVTDGALLQSQRELIRLRDEGATWKEVRPYLNDCVFRVAVDAEDSTSAVSD